MPHPSYRTFIRTLIRTLYSTLLIISIAFYGRSINVLEDNPWQQHLQRNQIKEKSNFLQKSIQAIV